MVKARDTQKDNKHYDLSHFVVHTGEVRRVGSNRFELQDKKEFIGLDNRLVRSR